MLILYFVFAFGSSNRRTKKKMLTSSVFNMCGAYSLGHRKKKCKALFQALNFPEKTLFVIKCFYLKQGKYLYFYKEINKNE
ncbi:hypothetical protein O3M35_009394 [Rhynocoris fuscipes]|uniref:Secreted protein n=1 Tax=Rhynocoris fuscipes TaxID=488301 RepID=A0AAW1D464_9HEMI